MPRHDFDMLVREIENAFQLVSCTSHRALAIAAATVAQEYVDQVLALLATDD